MASSRTHAALLQHQQRQSQFLLPHGCHHVLRLRPAIEAHLRQPQAHPDHKPSGEAQQGHGAGPEQCLLKGPHTPRGQQRGRRVRFSNYVMRGNRYTKEPHCQQEGTSHHDYNHHNQKHTDGTLTVTITSGALIQLAAH